MYNFMKRYLNLSKLLVYAEYISQNALQRILNDGILIWRMRASVIDHKKCPKSPHTSRGDFGHRNFTQLILLTQPGLFIYITLIVILIN